MSSIDPTQTAAVLTGVVVVLLLDFAAQHRAWGWLRLAQGRAGLRGNPGLQFVKIMGSGHGGGFGLRPSATHQGMVLVFDDERCARAFTSSPTVQEYIERSREHWLGTLAVTSVRGQWDQQSWSATPDERLSGFPFAPASVVPALPSMPVAVLTRGSIRPAKALQFWRYAPPAQVDLGKAAGCQLAMGLGEVPLVRQCTFSVWDNTAAMVAYAHQGAHRQAIAAAQRHDFFSESMFARMQVLAMSGIWCGRHYGDSLSANHSAAYTATHSGTRVVLPPAVALPPREVAHG